MRIYSNIKLSWPLIHIIPNCPRYFKNTHNFKITSIVPSPKISIISYSTIDPLLEDREYYCYNNFKRDEEYEKIGNVYKEALISDSNNYSIGRFYKSIYIPKKCEKDDIILIYKEPYINANSWSCYGSVLA